MNQIEGALVASDANIHVEAEARLSARATLFGEFLLADSVGTPFALSNRRARGLLAILCVEPDHCLAREQVTRLLWSGRFEAQAKASLRQCLLELGKALEPLGFPLLTVTRERVALNASLLRTDLAVLEQALEEGRHEDAIRSLVSMGAAPLLEGLNFGGSFADWLAARRKQIALRLQASVDHALIALDHQGNHAARGRLLAAWTASDPSVQAIAAPIRPDGKTRIAVLPFQGPGSHIEPDYFADGMVDELITTLGQVPQLLVAGRTSSFHFRNSDLAAAEIAAQLGVSHLIEGSVQRQGERVRIHAHLIAGDTGFELWGQRFDGTLDDVFALQENVGQAITAAIGSVLGIAMQSPRIQGMTHSKQAYDLFLQGRSLCAKRFGDGVLDTAVTLFEQALVFDPNFAECWVALAEAHQLIASYTQCLDRNGEAARMAECAARAIAIAPGMGYPYALLGIYGLTQNDFLAALDLGFQAYALEPNDPAVAMRLAYFLIFIGKTRDAIPYIRAAIDQDPVDARKYGLLWSVEFCTGDLDAAIVSAQRLADLGLPTIYLAKTLAVLGKHDLAIEQYLLSKQLVNDMILPPVGIGIQTPEAMDAYWLIAAKAICGGQVEDCRIYCHVLEMLYAVLHDKSDLAISGPAILTGNANLVFKSIGHSITPSNLIALVPLWADIDPMRQIWQHPEFIPFAQRIGMAAAWDKFGWPDLLPKPTNC